jgi:hypothetical protein
MIKKVFCKEDEWLKRILGILFRGVNQKSQYEYLVPSICHCGCEHDQHEMLYLYRQYLDMMLNLPVTLIP